MRCTGVSFAGLEQPYWRSYYAVCGQPCTCTLNGNSNYAVPYIIPLKVDDVNII